MFDVTGVSGPLQAASEAARHDPFETAVSRGELEDLGIENLREAPASVSLLRSAIAQDAGLTFAPAERAPLEGVGALLRWHDETTPREDLASLSRPTAPRPTA